MVEKTNLRCRRRSSSLAGRRRAGVRFNSLLLPRDSIIGREKELLSSQAVPVRSGNLVR